MGRTGKWFGFQHDPISPDIVAIGKGLGNGYPVSCTAVSGEVADRLETTGFRYSQSHQNDRLGAAVAGAVIDAIETERLVDRARETGEWFIRRLREVSAERPRLGAVRGRGLMIAMDFAPTVSPDQARETVTRLREAGLIVARRPDANTLRIDPPLNVEAARLERFLDALAVIA